MPSSSGLFTVSDRSGSWDLRHPDKHANLLNELHVHSKSQNISNETRGESLFHDVTSNIAATDSSMIDPQHVGRFFILIYFFTLPKTVFFRAKPPFQEKPAPII